MILETCKNCKNIYKTIPSQTVGVCQIKYAGTMKLIVDDMDYCDDFELKIDMLETKTAETRS